MRLFFERFGRKNKRETLFERFGCMNEILRPGLAHPGTPPSSGDARAVMKEKKYFISHFRHDITTRYGKVRLLEGGGASY